MNYLVLLAFICFSIAKNDKKFGKSDKDFLDYVAKNNKNYLTVADYTVRFETFKKNVDDINKKNADETDEAEYGVNIFTDFTEEEFKKLLGAREPKEKKRSL